MGRIDYFRRVQASMIRMIARSEMRWFEELNDANNGTLSASRLFRDMNAMADDSFAVWRNLFDFEGSPMLPHVHFERLANDVAAHVETERLCLAEPVPEEELIVMTDIAFIGPGAGGGPRVEGCVNFVPPGANLPAGLDRETLQVFVYGDGNGIPAVGFYTGVVLRGPLPWPLAPGRGTAIATVSVHLS